jgi:hypothetical protein
VTQRQAGARSKPDVLELAARPVAGGTARHWPARVDLPRYELRTAFGEIEAPPIEHGEGRDEARGGVAFRGSEASYLAEEIGIGELIERGK